MSPDLLERQTEKMIKATNMVDVAVMTSSYVAAHLTTSLVLIYDD